jgi:uncharacterized protein (DUF486 family)
MATTLKFIGLLIVSNTFMTIAWYGHLKHKSWPLLAAILISWIIALAEYSFQVPANRIGSQQFSLTQLKITQECVTLVVFLVYAAIVFREPIKWNTVVAMLLIVGAVFFAFLGKKYFEPHCAAPNFLFTLTNKNFSL